MDIDPNRAFDRAKRLSDFIGMFTRLAFLVLLTTLVAAQVSNSHGWTFVVYLCTLFVLGGFTLSLAWLAADVVSQTWTSSLNARIVAAIGGSRFKLVAVAIVGRLIGYVLVIGMMGLSISLINYGDKLARRLLEETPVHTE